MITFSLSPWRLVLLALCGSLIVLGGAIAAIVALWQPSSLQSILPGQNTTALFSNVTREDLRQWGDRFPVLRSVPDFDGRLELGILGAPGGPYGWILSSPYKDIPLPDANGDFHGQDVLLSDSGVMNLMTGKDSRLKTNDVFRELSRGISPTATLIYLRSNADESLMSLPSALRPFVHASGGLLLSKEGATARIRVFGVTKDLDGSVSGDTPLSPPPEMTLSLAAPSQMLDLSLANLPAAEQAIRRGQLLKKINDTLGGEWSMPYDILPLLKNPATLHLSTGTGSGPSFAFQGRVSDMRDANERLAAFHESIRGRAGAGSVTSRTFERGFTSTIVGSGPSQAQERKYSLHGWTVHETTDGGRSLVTAVRGRDIVIGNRKEWVEDIVADETPEPFPSLSGNPVAGGALSPALFDQWTTDMRGSAGWPWLSALLENGKSLVWSVEMDRNVLTLSVETRNER